LLLPNGATSTKTANIKKYISLEGEGAITTTTTYKSVSSVVPTHNGEFSVKKARKVLSKCESKKKPV
jgi:hypothetical protein